MTLPAAPGPWEPITADDNLTFGSRDQEEPAVRLELGCDLDALFPAIRPLGRGRLHVHLSDVFGETDPTTGRPARRSRAAACTSTASARSTPPGASARRTRCRTSSGSRSTFRRRCRSARSRRRHDPPGTSRDPPARAREPSCAARAGLDPRRHRAARRAPERHAARMGLAAGRARSRSDYRRVPRLLTRPTDVVHATVASVTSAPPNWKLALTTDLPLVADELAGQWITSDGYPFPIAQNDAGTTPTMIVETSKLHPPAQPRPGAVVVRAALAPEHQRPPGWDQRVAVYPLTAADTYRHVFYDVLTLEPGASESRPSGSACRRRTRNPTSHDERTAGALANRPGNESGIVTCAVAARYRGQPVFSVPPPLGDVPEIVTDEPTGRQVLVSLDLARAAGRAHCRPAAPVALERCSADDILSRTRVSGDDVVLTHPDGTPQTIAFPNPGDQAAVLATLNSADPAAAREPLSAPPAGRCQRSRRRSSPGSATISCGSAR